MSDDVITTGVPRLRFTPKTGRQKAAVIVVVMLLGFWISEPGSQSDANLTIGAENGEGTLAEIQLMLSELDQQKVAAESTTDLSRESSPDPADGVLIIPQDSVAVSTEPDSSSDNVGGRALVIPSVRPGIMQNASYTSQLSDSSNALPTDASGESRQPSFLQQPEAAQPEVKIRLTGSIQPIN